MARLKRLHDAGHEWASTWKIDVPIWVLGELYVNGRINHRRADGDIHEWQINPEFPKLGRGRPKGWFVVRQPK